MAGIRPVRAGRPGPSASGQQQDRHGQDRRPVEGERHVSEGVSEPGLGPAPHPHPPPGPTTPPSAAIPARRASPCRVRRRREAASRRSGGCPCFNCRLPGPEKFHPAAEISPGLPTPGAWCPGRLLAVPVRVLPWVFRVRHPGRARREPERLAGRNRLGTGALSGLRTSHCVAMARLVPGQAGVPGRGPPWSAGQAERGGPGAVTWLTRPSRCPTRNLAG